MLTEHWILVAGTGRRTGLPASTRLLAHELGMSLAEHSFGLVVGGWPGVDHVTARAFADSIRRGRALSDDLIQVVAAQRPTIFPEGAGYPDFRGGHLVEVPQGAREWIEALKYCDAVVLIGGEGGTLETFYYALQEQRPTFPVASTGGDAEKAFRDCIERWDTLPLEGISRTAFAAVLTMPIHDSGDARLLASKLMALLHGRFATEAHDKPKNRAVFVSYAHEDRYWLRRLRSVLRPLQQTVGFAVWDDQSMERGVLFEKEIADAIAAARVAILLVSDAFLRSAFIRDKEVPLLLERRDAGAITVLWLPIEGEAWRASSLSRILAGTEDVEISLASLPSAEQQDALVKLRKQVAAALGRHADDRQTA